MITNKFLWYAWLSGTYYNFVTFFLLTLAPRVKPSGLDEMLPHFKGLV